MDSYLVSAAQMRQLEAQSVAEGATWAGLMEQAGRGVAKHAIQFLGADLPGAQVLALVGPGNNGGDALVVARLLHQAGASVTLFVWQRRPTPEDWSWQAACALDLPVVQAAAEVAELISLLEQSQLVLDGLLGVGVNRPLAADLLPIIAAVNAAKRLVLAIDVPSGLNADTGTHWGALIKADLTVATGLFKYGHRLYPGAAAVGRLALAPIDLPSTWETSMKTTELSDTTLRTLLPDRPADSHKGTFGKVMVVAGSYFYPGAAVLAASAAARSGVGLVTLACPRSIYGGTLAALHEVTYLPLVEAEPGALSVAAADVILEKLAGYKALLVGCGLGREEPTREFLRQLLGLGNTKRRHGVGFLSQAAHDEQPKHRRGVGFMSSAKDKADELADQARDLSLPPLIIDADGLNLLAEIEDWQAKLRDHPTILTPHPREMARLLKVEQLGEDAVQIAADAAAEWGVVVVLKGAHTIIAAPDGQVTLHSVANAALATAGTGDVLAGLIAGLVAQGLAPFDAARLGVGIHGVAGHLVREELGDRGVLAGDLLVRLPLAFRHLVD